MSLANKALCCSVMIFKVGIQTFQKKITLNFKKPKQSNTSKTKAEYGFDKVNQLEV